MVKKRKETTVEDQLEWANRSWKRVQEEITKGIIDRDSIALSMVMLNSANGRAIQENKGHLIKY